MKCNFFRRCACQPTVTAELVMALFLFPGFLFSATVQTRQYRQHEAHVHGVANLNVAVDANNLFIGFSSPSANIVGFGHHPRSPEQKEAVKAALRRLKDGASIFYLDREAQGRLIKSSVVTDIDKHAAAISESGKADKKEALHGGDQHQSEERGRHSEFMANYQFVCQKPEKLTRVAVKLFEIFPGIEHIKVQLLTETRQSAMVLTANKDTIIF